MYIPIHEILDGPQELESLLSTRGWTQQQIRAALETLHRTYRNDAQYDYADNLRLARAENPEEVAAYDHVASEGCCGAVDERVTVTEADQSSTVILVGFNFGH